ncbi:RHS repeat-associated core domain-containing protein [Leptospira wolffii]|uniref:RHS repeat-associated core domain-containing protein n=1 Tax=Leptospira wolffii TaxID=409998 RepID=UPI001FED8AC8|nr:RHS repeat-associated core domain-containing protein [Leptospira wolffii]
MLRKIKYSILLVVLCSGFFMAWNPLRPVFAFLANAFGIGTSIPLPFPEMNVDFTGKPRFSLSVQTPPGAGDMVPQIAIQYVSGFGTGILGKGWTLSGLAKITKNASLGVHFTPSDGYASSQLGELIPSGSDGNYRSKIESFSKIQLAQEVWSVRDRSGILYEYGRNASQGSNSLVSSNGQNVVYYLDRVRDRYGNGYDVDYLPETAESAEALPKEIRYARGNARIQFFYEDLSGPWTEYLYSLGKRVQRKKLLNKIEVYAKDENGAESKTESYSFDYDRIDGEIFLIGFERDKYKSISFDYTRKNNTAKIFQSSGKSYKNSYFAGDPSLKATCDSVVAICACTADYACMVNSHFTAQFLCQSGIESYEDICMNGMEMSFTAPADMDGDGVPELVRVLGSKEDQKFSISKLSSWNTASSGPISVEDNRKGEPLGMDTQGQILGGDFNGDGKSDFLVLRGNGSILKIYYGPDFQSKEFSNIVVTGLGATDSRGRIFVLDVNGDGKSDFLQADSDLKIQVYLSTGSAFQKIQSLSMGNYGTEMQQFGDLDKNGVPDFLRMDSSGSDKKILVTFFDYKNGQLQAIEETSLSRNTFGNAGDQFLADLNGDGFADFAFFTESGSKGKISYYPFDGRKFVTNGLSPVKTIDVEGAYATKGGSNLGPSSQKKYVEEDLSGDGIKDRISYNTGNPNNTFFQIEIYDPNQSKYNSAFSLYWNTDTPVDLNGDGNPDTIRADLTSIEEPDNDDPDNLPQTVVTRKFQITISTGTGFEVPIAIEDYIANPPDTSSFAEGMYFNWRNRKDFVDLNGDGKADFLRYDASNSKLIVSYAEADSDGNITYSASGDKIWNTGGYLLSLDTNGDGKPEILGFQGDMAPTQYWKQSSAPFVGTVAYRSFPFESNLAIHFIRFDEELPSGLVREIRNGSQAKGEEAKLTIDYKLAKDHPGAIRSDLYSSASPEIVPFAFPDFLVTGFSQSVGETRLSAKEFEYSYARFYLNGLRNSSYIGFQKMVVRDPITNYSLESYYDPKFLEMSGSPTRQIHYKNGIKILESTADFNKTLSIFGGILVKPGEVREDRYLQGNLAAQVSVTQTFDSYGNTLTKDTSVNGTIMSEKTSYLNDWNAGILGLPSDLQVFKSGDLISHKRIQYADYRVSEVQELVSSGQWRSQFIQEYDGYGNPTRVQDSNGNISSLYYDSVVFKYPIRTVNSYGHTVLKNYDFRTGQEVSSTDPNGAVSRMEYDDWGRPVRSYLPGESDWSEKIEYENVGDLENELVRKVFRISNGETWQEESSNMVTGISKKRSSLANGYVLVEETHKNIAGQTLKKIDSYLEGSNPFSWTEFTYNGEGHLIKSEKNDGTASETILDGLETKIRKSVNGNVIEETSELKNPLGQILSRTVQGKTTRYAYSPNGKVSQITDPENGITILETDFSGRQTKVTSPNSGTLERIYDPVSGKVREETSSNGSKVSYEYDLLGRVTRTIAKGSDGEQVQHTYEYDRPEAPNGIGKLTKATDPLGTTEFEYDIRGNQTLVKKNLIQEDLTFFIRKKYNLQNQVQEATYPEGSVVKNVYSDAGNLAAITLTPGDGSGSDFPLVEYRGPSIEDGNLKLQRITGNGVIMDVLYDPVKKRPIGYKTGKDLENYQNISYTYDDYGNHTKIEDKKNPARTQTFIYDSLRRLTSASGVYGTEEYQYSDSGKLLKKGNLIYSYSDPAHRSAVTRVTGENVSTNYTYDSSGNITNRNGDSFYYDPFQKIKRIDTENQESIRFDYDFTGTRILKTNSTNGTKTISLGDMYEVVLSPGKSPQHTLYFRGNYGDIVGQWTRSDAVLVTYADLQKDGGFEPNLAWNTFLWNAKDTSIRGIKYLFLVPGTNIAFLYITLFLGLGFGLLSYREGIWKATLKFATPILLISFSHCSVLVPGGNGTPPWILPPQYSPDTPSVENPYQPGGPGSGAGIPTNGFLFLHPDHLGSITMATDGNGNRTAGGDQGGASHISYKPYGEIQRSDSSGPDVFRYKFTGQIEDKETGLYYYKARYYDPLIGRFLQPDSVMDPGNPVGMDQYMYTEGNPVRYTDPSGHSIVSSWLQKNGLGMLNFHIEVGAFLQRAFYVSSQRWSDAALPIALLFPSLAIGAAAAAAVGTAALAALTVMNMIGLLAASAMITNVAAMYGGAAALGLAAGAGLVGAALIGLGVAAAYFLGISLIGAGVIAGSIAWYLGSPFLLAAGLGAITALAAITYVAGILGLGGMLLGGLGLSAAILGLTSGSIAAIGAAILAGALATLTVGMVILAGLAALLVASALVMAALALAVTTGLIVIYIASILVLTGVGLVMLAAGCILSPYTLMAYVAGGLSKSSLNNIHWDEKNARIAGCYAATLQFLGIVGGGILIKAPWLFPRFTGIPPAAGAQTWLYRGFLLLNMASMFYDISQGDWEGALITMLSFEFGRFGAVSAAYSAGKISNDICGGTL